MKYSFQHAITYSCQRVLALIQLVLLQLVAYFDWSQYEKTPHHAKNIKISYDYCSQARIS